MKEFEEIIRKVTSEIGSALDGNIKSESYSHELYITNSIEAPLYNKERSSRRIGSEQLTMHNAPLNFQYTPGKMYPFAQFNYAVSGNVRFLPAALRDYHIPDITFNLNNSQKYILYKVFTRQPIEGNDALLEQLNADATNKKIKIEEALNAFKIKVDDFNKQLAEVIKSEIEKRKAVIAIKENSLSKLNPF